MIIERGVNLEVITEDKWYLIHYALEYSTLEIQKMIIERGVNLLVSDDTNKGYPIYMALRYSKPEIQKMIIERGGKR